MPALQNQHKWLQHATLAKQKLLLTDLEMLNIHQYIDGLILSTVFTLSLQITKTSLSSGGAEGVGRDHTADASREQGGRGGEAVLHAGV